MSERPSLFEFWEMPQHARMYESLSLLEPARAHELLHDIRSAEIEAWSRDHADWLAADVLPRLRLAPQLAEQFDLDEVARQHADYLARRYIDNVYLTMYFQREDVRDDLLSIVGLEHVLARTRRGRLPIITPLHYGSFPAIPYIVAAFQKVAVFIEADAWDKFTDITTTYVTEDGEERAIPIPMPDPAVMLRCLKALRDGRSLVLFPEFSYGGEPAHQVDFLGARVFAPEGAAVLAQTLNVPLVPAVMRRVAWGRFELRFSPPIVVERAPGAIDLALQRLFDEVARTVCEKDPGDWWCWHHFDRMVVPAGRRAA